MPLPLLAVPALIGGAAALAGAVGIKKGYDAKCDYDDAKRINSDAEEIYDKAEKRLNIGRLNTQNALESLGKIKYSILNEAIVPFIDAFSQIKNIDKTIDLEGKEVALPSKETIKQMKEFSLEIKEAFGGGVSALGAGGLAGLAAYGSVGTFATASTGTAIAGLSGAAATNATLAWLGGGTLASGGFGMAGGMAVLGGVVAGPVLAVGGMMLASKAEAAKEDAYTNLEASKLAAEEMELALTTVNGIKLKVSELSTVLTKLQNKFKDSLKFVQNLVNKEKDFQKYSDDEIKKIYLAFTTYETLSNLLEVQLMDEKGALTEDVKSVLEANKNILNS